MEFQRLRLHLERLLSLAALALFVAAGPLGCNALELLDESAAAVNKNSATQASDAEKSEAELAEQAAKAEQRRKTTEWWDNAQSLTKGTTDASISRCKVNGSTQFMRKQDCIARGGTPSGV